MHKTGHWPVYPRQVRTETLKARPPAGGTAHSRQALEAPSVQQVTGGIPNTYKTGSSDARPPSSEELMGAPAVLQPSREDIHKSGQPLAVELRVQPSHLSTLPGLKQDLLLVARKRGRRRRCNTPSEGHHHRIRLSA